ncbi:rhodanese-like domain-containing protein [Chloroflexota bacterium]
MKAKLDAGASIIIIDSRPGIDYNESHIFPSISMPLADMAEPYSDLDRYEEIITYCT